MSVRPWATKLLLWVVGGWFFLSIGMAYVASMNFAVLKPERLRNATAVYAALPDGEARYLALRYAASELNRTFFPHYGVFQIGLGAAAVALLLASGRRGWLVRGLLVAALLIAMGFHFGMTPRMIAEGRRIDFVSREPTAPPEVTEFMRFHDWSVRLESAKMLALLGVVVLVVRGADRRA